MKITYEKLVEDYKFERIGPYLSVKGEVPYSIEEPTFNFIINLIIKNNLQRGYELATGTGISALAAGLGFKETGGKLVSVDSYIENYTKALHYNKTGETYPKTEGHKMAVYLKDKFKLDNVVLQLGWSPNDIEDILERNFKDKLDYVFIDGEHIRDQIIKDISILKDFMGGGFMLFHDVSRADVRDAVVEGLKIFDHGDLNLVLSNLGMVKI